MATTKVAVAPMMVAQISKAGGDFEVVEREIPKPGAGQVRIKVQACGICHSDQLTKEGLWPGITYPRVPGHEVAGVIDEVGAGVSTWKKGQRVGVGWFGQQDHTCLACWRGDFRNCSNGKILKDNACFGKIVGELFHVGLRFLAVGALEVGKLDHLKILRSSAAKRAIGSRL